VYALVDDETGDRLGEFRDIERFFAADSEEYLGSAGSPAGGRAPLDFQIVGVDPHVELANLPERLNPSNLVIDILSVDGEAIGEYYLASAVLRGREDAMTGLVNVGVSALVDWIPHRDAKNVWKAWAVAPPARKGIWTELPLGSREGWLEVVGLYRRAGISRKSNDVTEFLMDGSRIEDLTSFFCAIGEAVNGPGGYYGWNLPALIDCLNGGRGARAPFVLRWSEFDVARRSLVGEVESAGRSITQLDLIIRILQEAGVEIRT
jgi:hypothetical protein